MRWIFGYGSLIWRPDFAFVEQRPALVAGWRRRFWQASPDHRGVPAAPGRVVTLVQDNSAVCHGMAFLPAAEQMDEIISALDVREQNGYELVELELGFEDGSSASGVTYIAGPGNPSFTGPEARAAQVELIARAHGPSGSNREYVVRLAEALSALGVMDDEVHGLRDALLDYERARHEAYAGTGK